MAVHYEAVHWMNGSEYNDFKFFEIGYQKCEPGYSYGPIIRDKHILHFILSGEGHLELDKKVYPLREKQAFFIPAGSPGFYQASLDNPWHYIWILFHGPTADDMLSKAGLNKRYPIFTSETECNRLEELLFEILESPALEYSCLGKLYEFFQQLILLSGYRPPQSERPSSSRHYVEMVMNYIAEKFSEPVHIQEIADFCGLDRSYLGKLFRQETGLTPQRYLMEFRMSRAKELLLNTNMPIQHVSYSVGYNDPLAFSKVFRQEVGLAPTAFRAGNR